MKRKIERKFFIRRSVAAGAALLVVVVIVAALTGSSSPSSLSRGRKRHARSATITATARVSTKQAGARQLVARENAAINRLLTHQSFISEGGPEKREVALTFDDGPGPYTPGVINMLLRYHAPATFFEIGIMLQYFHDSLSRELRRLTVAIGDHTETHPMMALLSSKDQQSEILEQTAAIGQYGAPFPRLYRPPYMSYDQATFKILKRLHMLMVLWTVDTGDYLKPGTSVIVQRALSGAKPGAIILLHDAGGDRDQTIAALPAIIRGLRARGYRLVTVPQLILDDPPEGAPQHIPATGAS